MIKELGQKLKDLTQAFTCIFTLYFRIFDMAVKMPPGQILKISTLPLVFGVISRMHTK